EAPDFGEKGPEIRRSKVEVSEQLRRDLRAVSTTNQYYFRICIVVLLVLFVGACALVLRSLNTPSAVAAIFGVTGVSLMGTITQMVKLWKAKVSADMMLAL